MFKTFKDIKIGDTLYVSHFDVSGEDPSSCNIVPAEVLEIKEETRMGGNVADIKMTMLPEGERFKHHITLTKKSVIFQNGQQIVADENHPLVTINKSFIRTGSYLYATNQDEIKDYLWSVINKEIEMLDKKIKKLQETQVFFYEKLHYCN